MTQQLAEAGVLFAATPLYVPAPDPAGTAHAPWADVPWKALPQCPRSFPELLRKDGQDPSVALRMRAGLVKNSPFAEACAYTPSNL